MQVSKQKYDFGFGSSQNIEENKFNKIVFSHYIKECTDKL